MPGYLVTLVNTVKFRGKKLTTRGFVHRDATGKLLFTAIRSRAHTFTTLDEASAVAEQYRTEGRFDSAVAEAT